MSILFTSAILFLGHLCVYFYFKNMIRTHSNIIEQNDIKKPQLTTIENVTPLKLTNSVIDNKRMLLQKNLRQLEFISKFEMHLEGKNLKNISLEFLQEFEKIKIEAQLSTLKTTSQLNNKLKMAA